MAVSWQEDALVLSVRPHGESSLLASVFTRAHGRHMGLVRGGTGRTGRGLWQPGNRLHATWRARLSDHLGTLSGELAESLAARVLDDADRLALLASLCALTDAAVPERDPVPRLYDDTLALATLIAGPADVFGVLPAPAALVTWELRLLADLGFGLDLTRCAATGTNDGLIYVSPKSGRAVSASAGEPFRDRMLALPTFLRPDTETPETAPIPPGDIADGLRLSGFFLERHLFGPRGQTLPAARLRLAERMARGAQANEP